MKWELRKKIYNTLIESKKYCLKIDPDSEIVKEITDTINQLAEAPDEPEDPS